MNSVIINNINKCCDANDILIHLGDWSFGGFDSIRAFYDRLICKNIYLFLGNHDHHIKNNRNRIKDIFLLVDKTEDDFHCERRSVHMGHYPVQSWKNLKKGAIHLHGHTHLSGDNRFGKGKKMDIGIDGHPEFRPYNLKTEIFPLMDNRIISSEYETRFDHHMDDIKNNDY